MNTPTNSFIRKVKSLFLAFVVLAAPIASGDLVTVVEGPDAGVSTMGVDELGRPVRQVEFFNLEPSAPNSTSQTKQQSAQTEVWSSMDTNVGSESPSNFGSGGGGHGGSGYGEDPSGQNSRGAADNRKGSSGTTHSSDRRRLTGSSDVYNSGAPDFQKWGSKSTPFLDTIDPFKAPRPFPAPVPYPYNRYAQPAMDDFIASVDQRLGETVNKLSLDTHAILGPVFNELDAPSDPSAWHCKENCKDTNETIRFAEEANREAANAFSSDDKSTNESEPYNFKSPEGPLREQIVATYNRLTHAQPTHPQGKAAKDFGIKAAKKADASAAEGNSEDAQFYTDVAIAGADIATGFIPGVSWGKDIYEATTGRSLITDKPLSDFDRGLAIIGAATVGVGSKIKPFAKAIDKGVDLLRPIAKAHLDDSLTIAKQIGGGSKKLFKKVGDLKTGKGIDLKKADTWPKPPVEGPFRVAAPSRAKAKARGEKSFYDSNGGEWRPAKPDKYHKEGHWDYKPPGNNSPWQNVKIDK